MIRELQKAFKSAGIMTIAQEERFWRDKYEGKPCRVCGENIRYVSNKRCVQCKHALDAENYQRRKLGKAFDVLTRAGVI